MLIGFDRSNVFWNFKIPVFLLISHTYDIYNGHRCKDYIVVDVIILGQLIRSDVNIDSVLLSRMPLRLEYKK